MLLGFKMHIMHHEWRSESGGLVQVIADAGDDQVDVGLDVPVQAERHLVLSQLLDRLLQVDLVAVDVDLVLGLERGRYIRVGDRAEGLVLGTRAQLLPRSLPYAVPPEVALGGRCLWPLSGGPRPFCDLSGYRGGRSVGT